MTLQNEKQFLTFDRIKIKCDHKYLLNMKVRFNETYNPRSGNRIGIYYNSKGDTNIPYNLYIAVDYEKQTLTIEFSSKILMDKYIHLISKTTIKECLNNINQLNICSIDVENILLNGVITSLDATKDVNLTLNDDILNALNTQVNNYRRYKWKHYIKEGITFTKDVASKDCAETITVYNKEKEIWNNRNQKFLNILSRPQLVTNYFKGKTRFEIKLNTPQKIMNDLNIADTKIFSVLNSDANPILTQFDKVFGHSSTNISVSDTTFDNYEDWCMKILIETYNGDLKFLDQEIRTKYTSRSGALKRMKKIEAVYHAMTSASTSENPIEKIRNLLL